MSRKDRVIVARLLSGLALLLLLIALIYDIISFFTPVKDALSSFDAFGSFLLGKLAIFVIIVITLVFLFITRDFTSILFLYNAQYDFQPVLANNHCGCTNLPVADQVS